MDAIRALERVRAAVPVEMLADSHPIGHAEEYIRFLALKLLRDEIDALPPSQSVESVWRTHILHPHEYLRTCQSLLPGVNAVSKHCSTPGRDSSSYEETLRMYEATFGVDPTRAVWIPASSQALSRQPQPMSIVINWFGTRIPVTIPRDAAVEQLKVLLFNVKGTAIERQRIVYAGRVLEDSKMLREYQIREHSEVHVAIRLGGGCRSKRGRAEDRD